MTLPLILRQFAFHFLLLLNCLYVQRNKIDLPQYLRIKVVLKEIFCSLNLIVKLPRRDLFHFVSVQIKRYAA